MFYSRDNVKQCTHLQWTLLVLKISIFDLNKYMDITVWKKNTKCANSSTNSCPDSRLVD